MNEKSILDKVVGALKTDPAFNRAQTEMLDAAILHDPALLVKRWTGVVGLSLTTPEGNFDITIARVKAHSQTAPPGG